MRKPKPTTARRLAREIDRHPTVLVATDDLRTILGDTGLAYAGRGINVTPPGAPARFYPFKQVALLQGKTLRCALVVVPDADLLDSFKRSGRLQPAPEWCAELAAIEP